MIGAARSFVPFGSLWKMAIDVPYSFLVRDGHHAWSCGQLALDRDAKVMAPNDIAMQSQIVSGYIGDILAQANIGNGSVKRLVLYYIDQRDGDRAAMLAEFRRVFGSGVLLDPVPVPHFYYDGVVLEVDVFAGARVEKQTKKMPTASSVRVAEDDHLLWISVEAPLQDIGSACDLLSSELRSHGLSSRAMLSGRWFAPNAQLIQLGNAIGNSELMLDAGASVGLGQAAAECAGHFIFLRRDKGISRSREPDLEKGKVRLTSCHAPEFGWIQARCTDARLDLVEQTKRVMRAIEQELNRRDLDFRSVVKATTHYVGGSQARELHDNMNVRNAYYRKPGPASTGLPVFGFADASSRITVDVFLKPDSVRWAIMEPETDSPACKMSVSVLFGSGS